MNSKIIPIFLSSVLLAVSATAQGVAPAITQEPLPAKQSWFPGQTATFSVQVSGTAPITNIWLVESNGQYFPLTDGLDANGSTISGATNTTLTISDLTLADGTNYEYIATNAYGNQTSTPAVLIIETGTPLGPIIDSQVPDGSISTISVFTNIPNKTNAFSVTVDASSAPPLTYQWYNGLPQGPATAIPGATRATYSSVDVAGVTLSCIVSNFVGLATSSPVALVAATPLPYQSAILAYNPVAYWPLNEPGGHIAFDYAGNNNGAYIGNCLLNQSGLPTSAGLGTTLSVGFDGTSAYVNVPVGKLNILHRVTVIQWVQTTTENNRFTTSLGHSDASYRLDVDGGGDPHFADASPDVVGTTAIFDGNWHQLIGVYDGTLQHLYVDGKQAAAPLAGGPVGSSDAVWIGGAPDYGTNRLFAGYIAQVAILTNALTAAQVASVYQSLDTPPVIFSITPASPSVFAGTSLTLIANTNPILGAGTPASSLQWYSIDNSFNSNIIAGATNATYTIADVLTSQDGYTFGIIAANPYGTNTASVTLTVQNGPPFLSASGDLSPLNGEAYVGAPVTYTVKPTGTAPFSFQWMVDGQIVSGATNSFYTAPAPCDTTTIQAAISNAQSAGVATLSSVATLQGDDNPTNITFNGNGTDWQLNGSLQNLASNVLELTDVTGGEASSAFYGVAQYVGSFTASFIYTAGGARAADGACFILQNDPYATNALGAPGGDLGFTGITNSLALEIDLYNFAGIGVGTNGGTYGSGGAPLYGPTGAVKDNSGHPIQFNVSWAHGVLDVLMTDTKTHAAYSTNYTLGPLTPILGGTDLAYIGFSGGDGGATAIQTISNFQFQSVIPPVTLAASLAADGSIVLSWPAADSTFVLQQTASLSAAWGFGPPPVVVGANNQVTVSVSSGSQMFYRLVRLVCR